jgi:hypothetical protein
MIKYLYTGDYALPEPTSKASDLPETTAEASDVPESILKASELGNQLRLHMGINMIADYYDLSDLSYLSATRIHDAIKTEWSADLFVHVLNMGFGHTGSKAFYKMAVEVTSAHLEELSTHTAFSKLDFPAQFTAQLLPAIYPKIDAIYNKHTAELNALKNAHASAISRQCIAGQIGFMQPSSQVTLCRFECRNCHHGL